MAFHSWVFRCWVFCRWVFRSNMNGLPTTYYILYNWMTFHCWAFRRWVFRTVTDEIPLLGIPSLGILLLGIPVILPGIPNDQNTQLFCWVFWSLDIPAVGNSRCWVFRTVTILIYTAPVPSDMRGIFTNASTNSTKIYSNQECLASVM